MTTMVTPSGVLSRGWRFVATEPYEARYERHELKQYRIRFAAPAAPELRLSVRFAEEDQGVWAHIDELNVSAEGADINEAFRSVIRAARDWLSYVREEEPDLAADLARQARFVGLLDAPEFSWFREFHFAE